MLLTITSHLLVDGASGGCISGYTVGILSRGDLAQADKMDVSSAWSGVTIDTGVGNG